MDCEDAANANNAKAPRKRSFFIVLLSFWILENVLVDICTARYKLLLHESLYKKGFHYFCLPKVATSICPRGFLERWQSGNAAAC